MWRTRLIAACLAVVAWSAPGFAVHDTSSDEDGHPPIVWIGTITTNILYLPAKLAYAGLGAVTGALAWAVTGGSASVARAIWDPSVRGTYVVTPAMMEGKEEAHFSGP